MKIIRNDYQKPKQVTREVWVKTFLDTSLTKYDLAWVERPTGYRDAGGAVRFELGNQKVELEWHWKETPADQAASQGANFVAEQRVASMTAPGVKGA